MPEAFKVDLTELLVHRELVEVHGARDVKVDPARVAEGGVRVDPERGGAGEVGWDADGLCLVQEYVGDPKVVGNL